MVQKNRITNKYDCVIIVGPTCSGKTSLSIELAKTLNTSIINADSQQIYKYLQIGTAKPDLNEMQGINHYLMDFVEPNKNFSVSDFKILATNAINEIKSQNKLPIIVGGTGFYIQSLLYDFSYGNVGANNAIRNKYMQFLINNGAIELHKKLQEVDPKTATILHPNDTKRVIRALEIYETTGQPMSKTITKTRTQLSPLIIGLNCDREILYSNINKRVDLMIQKGLENEINTLLKNGITFDDQCMQAIGYKEWKGYFENKLAREETIELIKKNTRNYAKRQLTWFRNSLENVCFYDITKQSNSEIVTDILSKLQKNHD